MDKLLILTYHAIDSKPSVISTPPTLFQWQMETLAAQNLTGISLSSAYKHMEKTGCFPENSVVLTFDDFFSFFIIFTYYSEGDIDLTSTIKAADTPGIMKNTSSVCMSRMFPARGDIIAVSTIKKSDPIITSVI